MVKIKMIFKNARRIMNVFVAPRAPYQVLCSHDRLCLVTSNIILLARACRRRLELKVLRARYFPSW